MSHQHMNFFFLFSSGVPFQLFPYAEKWRAHFLVWGRNNVIPCRMCKWCVMHVEYFHQRWLQVPAGLPIRRTKKKWVEEEEHEHTHCHPQGPAYPHAACGMPCFMPHWISRCFGSGGRVGWRPDQLCICHQSWRGRLPPAVTLMDDNSVTMLTLIEDMVDQTHDRNLETYFYLQLQALLVTTRKGKTKTMMDAELLISSLRRKLPPPPSSWRGCC